MTRTAIDVPYPDHVLDNPDLPSEDMVNSRYELLHRRQFRPPLSRKDSQAPPGTENLFQLYAFRKPGEPPVITDDEVLDRKVGTPERIRKIENVYSSYT